MKAPQVFRRTAARKLKLVAELRLHLEALLLARPDVVGELRRDIGEVVVVLSELEVHYMAHCHGTASRDTPPLQVLDAAAAAAMSDVGPMMDRC